MKKAAGVGLFLAVGLMGWFYGSGLQREKTWQDELKITEKKEQKVIFETKLEEQGPGLELKDESDKGKEAEEAMETVEAIETEEKPTPPLSRAEEAVLENYRWRFLALQNEYMGKINALVSEAKAEYAALPKDKKSEARVRLSIKYLEKGNALEAECDARFEGVLSEMAAELRVSGLPEHGLEAAREAYNLQKNARRSQLIGTAMKKEG